MKYAAMALIALLWAATISSGADRAAAAQASDVAGIAWFEGNVADAFKSAAAANKPVFLYWGAKWCPPCQQLKSTVFLRSDFIAKSKQFVSVHLDGDDPGAQKWGEKFHVLGYPTVLILRPDKKEITRIVGGTDLSVYADLFDAALNDLRPMSVVILGMQGNAAISSNDCRRLAYYGWIMRDFSIVERKALAAGLARAVALCGGTNAVEGARMAIASAAMSASGDTVTQVIAIVENPAMAPRVADALETLDSPFFKAVHARGPAAGEAFLRAWSDTMDGVAGNPAVIDADQLAVIGARLAAVKELAKDKKVPEDIAAGARARVAAILAKKFDPYVRAGVVNSASYVYEQLGDDDAQYALVKGELATARSPYYYMLDLGEIEESRHHPELALSWYERAYRESEGTATRFQWGAAYLGALLRLAPADHARIRDTGLELIAELDGPDRIQARTRYGLEKLDKQLRKWNSQHQYDADIQALHARMSATCGKLPDSDAGRGSCRKFLG
jgi:thiol-disulfide isomerase/thioredoxin